MDFPLLIYIVIYGLAAAKFVARSAMFGAAHVVFCYRGEDEFAGGKNDEGGRVRM